MLALARQRWPHQIFQVVRHFAVGEGREIAGQTFGRPPLVHVVVDAAAVARAVLVRDARDREAQAPRAQARAEALLARLLALAGVAVDVFLREAQIQGRAQRRAPVRAQIEGGAPLSERDRPDAPATAGQRWPVHARVVVAERRAVAAVLGDVAELAGERIPRDVVVVGLLVGVAEARAQPQRPPRRAREVDVEQELIHARVRGSRGERGTRAPAREIDRAEHRVVHGRRQEILILVRARPRHGARDARAQRQRGAEFGAQLVAVVVGSERESCGVDRGQAEVLERLLELERLALVAIERAEVREVELHALAAPLDARARRVGAVVDRRDDFHGSARAGREIREREADAGGDRAVTVHEPELRDQRQLGQDPQPRVELALVPLQIHLVRPGVDEEGLELLRGAGTRSKSAAQAQVVAAAVEQHRVRRITVWGSAVRAAHAQPAGAAGVELVELVLASEASAAQEEVVARLGPPQLQVHEVDEQAIFALHVGLEARLVLVAADQEAADLDRAVHLPAARDVAQRDRRWRVRIQEPVRAAQAFGMQERHAARIRRRAEVRIAGVEPVARRIRACRAGDVEQQRERKRGEPVPHARA